MSGTVSGSPRLGVEVHAALVGDDIVALDLRRGAYLCLPAQDLGGPTPRSDPHELAGRLGAAGLDCRVDRDAPSPYRPPERPLADLGDPAFDRFTLADVRDASRASLDVLRSYRGRSLSELVATIERSRSKAAPGGADVPRLARRFQRWSVLAPVPGKCLVRSFMLLRFLQRHGASAQWVFGVATWPFRAHCWVQYEGLVLDDHHERLIPYVPLLAVRA